MRIFFHLQYDGETVPDEEGLDYGSLHEAREEARRAARELIANHLQGSLSRLPQALVLTDTNGSMIDTVSLKSVIPAELK